MTSAGPDSSSIMSLWNFYNKYDAAIPGRISGKWYEVHGCVGGETGEILPAEERHFCLVGAEVKTLQEMPLPLCAWVLPAGKYAIFEHNFADGGFDMAFKAIDDWFASESSGFTRLGEFDIQVYDERFKGPESPDSVIEVWVPVKDKA